MTTFHPETRATQNAPEVTKKTLETDSVMTRMFVSEMRKICLYIPAFAMIQRVHVCMY